MTSPQFSGIPTPVAGVTGGQGLPPGVAAVDGSTGNVVIQPPNNVIQQQKGVIPQTFQVYETFTNNSNYIRVALSATSGGPFRLRTEFAGTGAGRDLIIGTGNGDSWRFQSNVGGSFIPITDNTVGIGSPAFRIQNLYSAGIISTIGLLTGAPGVSGGTSIYGGTLAPPVGLGVNGDFFFRSDTPGTANQRIYIKSAGAWVALTV